MITRRALTSHLSSSACRRPRFIPDSVGANCLPPKSCWSRSPTALLPVGVRGDMQFTAHAFHSIALVLLLGPACSPYIFSPCASALGAHASLSGYFPEAVYVIVSEGAGKNSLPILVCCNPFLTALLRPNMHSYGCCKSQLSGNLVPAAGAMLKEDP